MRTITAVIKAYVDVSIEVADDATEAQVAEAIVEACPKYPDLKAGESFDPADFSIVDDTRWDEPA